MKKERPRPLARFWKKISSAGIVTGMFSLMIVGWIQLLLILDSGWGGRSAAEFTARSKVWETITVVLLVLSVFEKKCGRLLSFAIVVLFLICVAVQDLAIVFVGFFYYLPFISFPLLALLFTVFRRPDEQW